MHELVKLGLNVLQDGECVEAVDEELERVCRDVIDRGLIEKARSVTLTIEVKPDLDKDSGKNFPNISWKVASKVPGRLGRGQMGEVRGDEVVVNVGNSSGDVRQETMFPRENIEKLNEYRKN